MKLDLFFFLCLFELILQEVQPNIVYLYWNGTNPQMHLSVHSLNNNRVSLYVDGIYTKIQYVYYNGTNYAENKQSWDLIGVSVDTAQIRTCSSNDLSNDLRQFIIFSNLNILKFSAITSTLLPFLPGSATQSIIDVAYGDSYGQIFAITRSSTQYYLKNMNSTFSINTTLIISGQHKPKIYYHNQLVYVHSFTYFSIFSFNLTNFSNNFTDNYINRTGSFISGQVDIDVSRDGKFFCYFTPTQLIVGNSTNLIQNRKFPFANFVSTSQRIVSAKFTIQRFIVLLSNNNTAYLFDYEIGLLISSIYWNPNYNKIYYVQPNRLVTHIGFPTAFQNYYVYQIDNLYNCQPDGLSPNGLYNCLACVDTYFLNSQFKCQKNLTSPLNFNYYFSLSYFLDTHMNGSNAGAGAGGGGLPPNTSTNNVSNLSNQEVVNQLGQIFQNLIDNQQIHESTQVISSIVSISSVRIAPRSLLSITCFLDDLQLYVYHRTKYPKVVVFFTTQADFMSQVKMSTWFLQSYEQKIKEIQQNTNILNHKNEYYYNYLNFTAQDPSQVYFLNGIRQIYTTNLFSNISIYLILKLVHFLTYLVKNKFYITKLIYNKFFRQTKWWTLVVTIFQANMVKLGFSIAIQFKIPAFFSFQDKLNFICALLVGLFTILYALIFYPLILKYYKKRSAQILLAKSKQEQKKSFIFQPLCIVFRNLLRSFIQGIFQQSYRYQISGLVLVDMISIFLILKMKETFKNTVVFVCCLIYSIVFVVFDLYFVVQSTILDGNPVLIQQISLNRELFSLITLCILLLMSVMITLALMLPEIYQFFKDIRQMCTKNKVRPSLEQNNDNNKVQGSRIKCQSPAFIQDECSHMQKVQGQNPMKYKQIYKFDNTSDLKLDGSNNRIKQIIREKSGFSNVRRDKMTNISNRMHILGQKKSKEKQNEGMRLKTIRVSNKQDIQNEDTIVLEKGKRNSKKARRSNKNNKINQELRQTQTQRYKQVNKNKLNQLLTHRTDVAQLKTLL